MELPPIQDLNGDDFVVEVTISPETEMIEHDDGIFEINPNLFFDLKSDFF